MLKRLLTILFIAVACGTFVISGTMMIIRKIKSEMRLILVLIAFLSCTFCTGRKTKKDMLETYSVLKTTDLSDFSCWRISERGDWLILSTYYAHKDSTSYQYTSSGSLLPMSKYRSILFYLNEHFDS